LTKKPAVSGPARRDANIRPIHPRAEYEFPSFGLSGAVSAERTRCHVVSALLAFLLPLPDGRQSPRSSGVLHTVGIDLQLTMCHSADISSANVSSTPDGLASRQTDAIGPIPSSDHIRCARRLETLTPPYSYVGRQFVPSLDALQ
jgi:hypothetical protein